MATPMVSIMPSGKHRLVGQVQDSLGSYGAWEERCLSGSQILVDGKLCGPIEIEEACASLDCFGSDEASQRPLPKELIQNWQQCVQQCKGTQKSFRQEHPVIESVWEMGPSGVADCRDGLDRIAKGQQIKQDQEPIMFSSLTRYLPNAALQAEHAARVVQVDDSKAKRRWDRLAQPLGFRLNTATGKALQAGDREELESALCRLQELQELDGESYDHQALDQMLGVIGQQIRSNVKNLEAAQQALSRSIKEAQQFHQQSLEEQSRESQRQRRSRAKQQFKQSVLEEISSSQ